MLLSVIVVIILKITIYINLKWNGLEYHQTLNFNVPVEYSKLHQIKSIYYRTRTVLKVYA